MVWVELLSLPAPLPHVGGVQILLFNGKASDLGAVIGNILFSATSTASSKILVSFGMKFKVSFWFLLSLEILDYFLNFQIKVNRLRVWLHRWLLGRDRPTSKNSEIQFPWCEFILWQFLKLLSLLICCTSAGHRSLWSPCKLFVLQHRSLWVSGNLDNSRFGG